MMEVEHLKLRPAVVVSAFMGALGGAGVLLGLLGVRDVLLNEGPNLGALFWPVAVLAASLAFGLFYATTEVHATVDRLWLGRYGLVWWSVPMRCAGTSEGRGPDWRLVFVHDLETGRPVGSINWWVMRREEHARFARFVDEARIRHGVAFDDPGSETVLGEVPQEP